MTADQGDRPRGRRPLPGRVVEVRLLEPEIDRVQELADRWVTDRAQALARLIRAGLAVTERNGFDPNADYLTP